MTKKSSHEDAALIIERYKTLTDNIAAAIVIRDKNNKITYCSPYTEVLTGYPLSAIYQSKEDFFVTSAHDEDKAQFKRALAVGQQGEAFQFRYRFFHKTGIEMWAEMRNVPVMDDRGTVMATLSITLDVTGTVRYQQQVEEKNKDLQDFAYMISHDLKAPIFTIKGMINILETDHKELFQGECGEILNHINSASQRLNSLVHAVLEYSKVTTRQNSNEPVSLDEVFTEVLNDHHSLIIENKAKINIPKKLPFVFGDKLMVYQIFSNLIGNSIKYRDPNRDITVTIDIQPAATRNYLQIVVSDTGVGIADDKLEAIFRPFQRVHKGDVEGTGIGLACVKKLVSKLNGDIAVESSVGVGSTFKITLPAYHQLILDDQA